MRDSIRASFEPSGLSRRAFLQGTGLALAGLGAEGAQSKPPELSVLRAPDRVTVRFGERDICTYQLTKPAGSPLPVGSACYFHPVATPGGTVVTEVAPEDQRNLRGLFLAWPSVRGVREADFWGAGKGGAGGAGSVVNRIVEAPPPGLGYTRLRLVNDWRVGGENVLVEDFRVGIGPRDGANALDVSVQLAAPTDATLNRSAFGGLALRARKDAVVAAIGPEGVVGLPPARAGAVDSNWPDAPWYGFHLKPAAGREATVVAVGRAANPRTTWHVIPGSGLINPCITAVEAVRVAPDRPLVLRYCVLTFDGPPNLALIRRMADAWYRPPA